MKIIVSHDVDHIYPTEHLFDGVLLKFAARAAIEGLTGVLQIREFLTRVGDLFRKRWHHVDELMDFDQANGIPSTFFFAMKRGIGLNYKTGQAIPVIRRVAGRGFECGVHGIAYENQADIDSEFQQFSALFPQSEFGIRMHYLRMAKDTLSRLDQAGYLFDTSESSIRQPYRSGNIWEFPLHIMDSREFYDGKRWQTVKTAAIIDKTKRRIAGLEAGHHQYVTLLFHDRYFSGSHQSFKLWYETIISYLKENGHSFIGYRDALRELS